MSINIVVPEMGESIVDARVARWLKNEGDSVEVGEALVELETDKVDVEVSAPKGGVLAKIAHAKGDDVKIGDVLGMIDEGASAAAAASEAPRASAKSSASEPPNASGIAAGFARPATPSARRAAREQNVDLNTVKPAGPRVTKDDVAKASADGRASAGGLRGGEAPGPRRA